MASSTARLLSSWSRKNCLGDQGVAQLEGRETAIANDPLFVDPASPNCAIKASSPMHKVLKPADTAKRTR
ncbi:MAG: hypothetical protein ABFC96_11640 [Thermoguttaceae bacterium]